MVTKDIAGLNGKKVVVTGASGYIGSALVKTLMKRSCEVVRISRKALAPIEGTRDIVADISERKSWGKIISGADLIYHLAGNTSAKTAEDSPTNNFRTTVSPINYLYEAMLEKANHPRIVFTSTATVYGITANSKVNEKIQPRPLTIYDEHKLIAEKLLKLYNQFALESVTLRLANVYGQSVRDSASKDRGILNRIAKLALQGQDLVLYGDGNYIRDYVYIDDVVDALLVTGSFPGITGEVFNIGTGIGTTLTEAFNVVSSKAWEIAKVHTEIVSQPWPVDSSPIEFRNFIADTSHFKTLTGWRASTQFESGIMLMIGNLYNKNKK